MKNFFFQHPKAPPFGFSKTVFAVQGGNFSKKKILRFWKSLKYVQECPVKCLWLKSKIAQLSPPPTIGYFWKVMRFVKTKNFRINLAPALLLTVWKNKLVTAFWFSFVNISDLSPWTLYLLLIDTTKQDSTYSHNNSKSQKTDWSLQLKGLVWRN